MKILSHVSFATFLLLLIFTRSFAGVYIFGYRIGEYLVAFGLLSFVFFVFKPKFQDFPNEIITWVRILFLSFLQQIRLLFHVFVVVFACVFDGFVALWKLKKVETTQRPIVS